MSTAASQFISTLMRFLLSNNASIQAVPEPLTGFRTIAPSSAYLRISAHGIWGGLDDPYNHLHEEPKSPSQGSSEQQ